MIEIKDGNYKAQTSNGYVLLDIWMESCQPCIRLTPILEEIANEVPNIKIVKMNPNDSEENMSSVLDLGVRSVPALFLFKNGAIVHQWVGFKSKPELMKLVDSYR